MLAAEVAWEVFPSTLFARCGTRTFRLLLTTPVTAMIAD